MKKYGKRLGAILTASLMAFSMATPAFGNPTPPPTIDPGEVVGQGTISDLDWPDYELGGTLPTGSALAFAIDPFGHLTLNQGDVVCAENRNNQVVFTESLVRANITGSQDVILEATLRLSNTVGTGLPAGVNVSGTASAVAVDEERNVLFWAQPSRTEMRADNATFVGANGGFAIPAAGDDGGMVLTYRLLGVPSEVYASEVTGGRPTELDRRPIEAGDMNSIAINFGGIFNADADWGADALQLRLVASFTAEAVYENATIPANPYFQHAGAQFAHGLLGAGLEHLTAVDSGSVEAPPTPIEIPATGNLVTVTSEGATGATGGGVFPEDATVTIFAGTRTGFNFTGWTVTVGDVILDDASSATTTFEMPDEPVTVVANWEAVPVPGFIVTGERHTTHSVEIVAGEVTPIPFTSDGIGVISAHLDGAPAVWNTNNWSYNASEQAFSIRLGTASPGRVITVVLGDSSVMTLNVVVTAS